jgi:hypothetical protein
MNRRIFIQDMTRVVGIGLGTSGFMPSDKMLKKLSFIGDNFEPYHFPVWEERFQSIYQKKDADTYGRVDKVIQHQLKVTQFPIGHGYKGKNPKIAKHLSSKPNYLANLDTSSNNGIYNRLPDIPAMASTPVSHLAYSKNGGGIDELIGFENRDNDSILFVKNNFTLTRNTSDEYIMVLPEFNKYVANSDWFCIGIPSEKPVAQVCSCCSRFYYSQMFAYQPVGQDAIIYGDKIKYTRLIFNAKCSYCKTGYHDNATNISELKGCTCYNDVKVETIDPGNLNNFKLPRN